MAGSFLRGPLVACTLVLGDFAWAADPPATLPSPQPVDPPVLIVPAPPVYRLYTPPLSREVWQAYGVDARGFWRPRVVRSPYGDSYFLYNGASYPWTQMHPEWTRGRVVD